MLADKDLERYSRQIRLAEVGIAGQEKLKQARVLVVGAGGLGSPVLEYLVAAGVGHIGIVDYDLIDLSNLNRQVLYSENETGRPKVIQAEERLRQMSPDADIRVYFQKLNKDSALEIVREYDMVVDCTDNFAVRYLISDTCVMLKKPVIYGAVYQFEGHVTVFNYRNGPTLRCLQPDQPHPLEVPSCAEGGIIGTIAGIIGTMQANETIKVILGIGEVLSGKVFVFNALTCRTYFFHLERSTVASDIAELGDYEEVCKSDDEPARQLSKHEVRRWLAEKRDFQIIDVSDPSDQGNHDFPCSKIPSFHIAENLDNVCRDKPVVFICPMGIKSTLVVNYLELTGGFTNLYSLAGGYSNKE